MSLPDLTLPDHACLYGFAQGDGTLSSSSRRRGRLSIEVSAVDAEHIERLAEVVPVRKSGSVAPPRVPFSLRDYFRGLVDADGSVGLARAGYPFVSLCTSSDAIASAFGDFVESVAGRRKVVRPNARDGARNIMVTRELAQELASDLYYAGALALPRKHRRADEVLTWVRPLGVRRGPPRRAWSPEEDAVVLERPTAEACAILGRTVNSVVLRRRRLRRVGAAA